MVLDKLDLAIIALYLAGITLFGLRFRKKQRTLRDYFLADRNIPWWAIALSIVAAETSTLTIIGIPGLAYDTNLTFLQVVMGYVVGRVIISFVLLPHYFRGDLYTAYELIERRFGKRLRSLTAGLFLVTRAAAEGVRVYAVSIVVAIALGTGEIASIAIITTLTLIYTFEGGLAAVIWTDVVQTVIYVGGTLVGLFTILHLVPGGWPAIHLWRRAPANCGFSISRPDFWRPYTFWAGLVGGAFFTTASHGTDQLIVQRLLAARNQRQSVAALLSSGIAVLFQFALFLMIGVMLFAFYHVPSASFGKADRIYPDIHCEPDAARNFGTADRGDSGGSDVEPERRAQLAFFHVDHRFLSATASADGRTPQDSAFADRNFVVGAVAVRAGGACRCTKSDASSKWDCRSRPWPMVRCLECFCSAC